MTKVIAIVLIVLVFTGFIAMLGFGTWKKYYEPEISWSNYNQERVIEE